MADDDVTPDPGPAPALRPAARRRPAVSSGQEQAPEAPADAPPPPPQARRPRQRPSLPSSGGGEGAATLEGKATVSSPQEEVSWQPEPVRPQSPPQAEVPEPVHPPEADEQAEPEADEQAEPVHQPEAVPGAAEPTVPALDPHVPSPVKRAPAKRAAAKKAPAKKAPAKKAPAKKAPARTPGVKAAASSTSPARRRELAERLAAIEGSLVAPGDAESSASGLEVVTGRRTSRAAARPAAQDVRPDVEEGRGPSWVRWLLALSLLLVATAVGLGAAALVEAGPRTWRSTAVAELEGGPAPTVRAADAVKAGQQRYAAQVPQLTEQAASAAALPPEAVRSRLTAVPEGDTRLLVTAEASEAEAARRLARAGVDTLVAYVPADQQAVVASEGDRLGAEAVGAPSAAIRVAPDDTRAAVVGLLAGGAVLLLALTALVLRRGRA